MERPPGRSVGDSGLCALGGCGVRSSLHGSGRTKRRSPPGTTHRAPGRRRPRYRDDVDGDDDERPRRDPPVPDIAELVLADGTLEPRHPRHGDHHEEQQMGAPTNPAELPTAMSAPPGAASDPADPFSMTSAIVTPRPTPSMAARASPIPGLTGCARRWRRRGDRARGSPSRRDKGVLARTCRTRTVRKKNLGPV